MLVLPRAGHWTPLERQSRRTLAKVLEWYVQGGPGDVAAVAREVYPDVKVKVRK